MGVLISGTGSNLQAIIDRIAAGRLDGSIRLVVSNRPGAGGLARAEAAGIPTRVIEHGGFAQREDFDSALVAALRDAGVELVALAGFDRLVTPVLIQAFRARIMNIHPALLPAFKGLHAQRQALEYGVKIAGATVHFVDEETDHGPIIIQGRSRCALVTPRSRFATASSGSSTRSTRPPSSSSQPGAWRSGAAASSCTARAESLPHRWCSGEAPPRPPLKANEFAVRSTVDLWDGDSRWRESTERAGGPGRGA